MLEVVLSREIFLNGKVVCWKLQTDAVKPELRWSGGIILSTSYLYWLCCSAVCYSSAPTFCSRSYFEHLGYKLCKVKKEKSSSLNARLELLHHVQSYDMIPDTGINTKIRRSALTKF